MKRVTLPTWSVPGHGLAIALACFASTFVASSVRAQEVTFPATDGATVFATWYRTGHSAKAVIVAFHQGGSSAEAEYAPIAMRLNSEGYDVLAVDQRAGGDGFGGVNRTVAERGGEAGYCEAAPDVAGAVAYAHNEDRDASLVLWGSSFSGALVLRLAATNPEGVIAVLAFSPASGGPMVDCRGETVSGEIRVPTLALRPVGEMSRQSAVTQFELFREQGHHTFVADPGAHGSSMLVEERVGASVEPTWEVVLEFLGRFDQ